MAITSIKRSFVTDPSLVHLIADDAYSTVIGSSYLADQEENIKSINNGAFDWQDGDQVLAQLSDGNFYFNASVANDGSVTLDTPSDAVQVSTYTKEADDGTAAATLSETPVVSFSEQVLVLGIRYLPSAALTADNTDFASLLVDRRAADGSTPENIATITTEITGTNDWVAFVAEDFGSLSNNLIAAGGAVTFEITKDGSGVVVPAGTLQIDYVRL